MKPSCCLLLYVFSLLIFYNIIILSKLDFLPLFTQTIYGKKDQKTKQIVKMEPSLTALFFEKRPFLPRSSPLNKIGVLKKLTKNYYYYY